jgi:hypothetical protein
MNKDTADLLHETLDVIDKHTTRLDTLDKKTNVQTKEFVSAVATLEKQIESSSKDVLLQLVQKGNTDKDQLVKDITNAIATNIAKLSINAGDITVNVETDSIAKVISKLPINNTNNIVIDTEPLVKSDKQFLSVFQTISSNLNDSMIAMKLLFQEVSKKEKPPIIKPVEKEPMITGMVVSHNEDGVITSVKFTRD